jgi:predicted PurR-regulated permease PerM
MSRSITSDLQQAAVPSVSTASGLGPLGVAALIIAALYVGREVFVPVALAILLSFVLAPLIRLVQRAGVPRAIAVVIVVIIAAVLHGSGERA